jgi:hypothetical protein
MTQPSHSIAFYISHYVCVFLLGLSTVLCPTTADLQDRVYICRLSCHSSSPKNLRGNVSNFRECLIRLWARSSVFLTNNFHSFPQ